MAKNIDIKGLALRVIAVIAYLTGAYAILGPDTTALFSAGDFLTLAVGTGLLSAASLIKRGTEPLTARATLSAIRGKALLAGAYASIILLTVYLRGQIAPGAITLRELFSQVRPFLYAVPIYILLPGEDEGGDRRQAAKKETQKEPLTRREIEIVALIREGLTNAEIGERLFISEYTVKKHVYNIFVKLGINHRAELRAENSTE